MADARDLDLLASAALRPAESATLGGWLVRRTPPGRPRRVNSALPPPRADGDGIDAVERWYRERASVPYVQVSPAEAHATLDGALAARGWALEAPTDVLVATAAAARAASSPPHHRVDVADDGDRLLIAAAGGAGGATVVLQVGWSIVLDLEVAAPMRRQGVARSLLSAWASLAGDRSLYLQVERDNAAARALYRAAGFTRSHGYHYRRAPDPGAGRP